MNYEALKIRKEGAVDWVSLNRPDSLNTMNKQLVDELQDYFGNLQTDHSVRVVVLSGEGRAFCAGLDLKEDDTTSLSERGPAAGLRFQRRISEIVMRMRRCPQAIVSLVHGAACGGGFALALASDIRIAGESAKMNAAFVRIGLSGCDIGVSYFLPRLVGTAVAAELLMTGRFIHADRALRVGLVSEVVPDADLHATAQSYVADLLHASPLGLRLTKECLNISVDAGSLEAAVAMEDRNQILCTLSSDFGEGINAFMEKREPVYKDA